MSCGQRAYAGSTWRTAGSALALWAALSMLLLVGARALAQDEDEPLSDQAEPNIVAELDIAALLTSERVFEDSIDGPVWSVQAQPGRRLIHVPIRFERVAEEVRLRTPPIDVRGGFFVAWHIELAGASSSRGASRGMSSSDAGGASLDLADTLPDSLPQDAPQFTRAIALTPDGRVHWELERNIPGGEVQDGEQIWRLKLRPGRVRELYPERPERPSERSAQAQGQWREAMVEYRNRVRELQELQRAASDLREAFAVAERPHLWAIYSVPAGGRDWTFRGEAPLPWTLSMEQLQMLRDRAQSSDMGANQHFRAFNDMAADGHPLTLRAIAHALHHESLGAEVASDTPLYDLLATIIRGDDEPARQRVLRDLANAQPPSRAALMLLEEATPFMTPQTKLLSLQSLLQSDLGQNVQRRQEMINTANRLLADAQGPEPGDVLQMLIDHIGGGSPVLLMSSYNIEFAPMPEARRDLAIAYAIGAAGESPLAANWVDYKLLGSNDRAMVRRTLELLGRAKTGPSAIAPIVDRTFDLILNRRHDIDDQQRAALTPRLETLIPINSNNHSLYRLLNSGDDALQRLAWNALPLFRLPASTDESGRERYEQLLSAAINRNPTPHQLVAFLDNQPDRMLAARGLVRVVLEGDDDAAHAAAGALLGSERPLAEVLLKLDRDRRYAFAQRMYQALTGGVPMTVGLMRDRESEAGVKWFGQRVAAGELPNAAQWGQVYDESELVRRAASVDAELARGAVAALVGQAGGDPRTARTLAARFANQSDRSTERLGELWQQSKREVYARRLAEAAGNYRLAVRPPARDRRFEAPAPIVLGVVELVTTSDAAHLGRNQTVTLSIPGARFAMRIENLNELKNFEHPELNDLALDQAEGPLDLLPQDEGGWRGAVDMGGGELVVQLEPTG